MYTRPGLRSLGLRVRSGAVTYELLSETVPALWGWFDRYERLLRRLEARAEWRLEVQFWPKPACYHGGACFEAIGVGFDGLDRRERLVPADILDAWFSPAPGVLSTLSEHLPWLVQTSPPAGCEGMVAAIAGVRGVDPECLVVGAGSSDLIFLAFRHWLGPSSRALILDPTYGEYAHVLERVVGCRVDRLRLCHADEYELSLSELETALHDPYDLVVLVNPNSPTGRYVQRGDLERALSKAPVHTRVWKDETYIEYAGQGQSLESFAASSENMVVCKSMSKVYALSGLRVGYLCAPPLVARELRALVPPWAVGLPGQLAAIEALRDPAYYQGRYRETGELRERLMRALHAQCGLDTIPGVANFALCHLPEAGPDAATVVEACKGSGVYLRDASGMGVALGNRALRIAVRDEAGNRRIVDALSRALRG